jgi:multidrug efflux pump subunit AcrB
MSVYDIVYTFTATVIVGLVVLVLLNKRNKTAITFVFLLLSLVGWVLSLFIFYKVDAPDLVLFLGRLNISFGVSSIFL